MTAESHSTASLTHLSRAAGRVLVGPAALIVTSACADLTPDPLDARAASLRRATTIETVAFLDPFDVFDDARWSVQEHALGKGHFRASNVQVRDDALQLVLPRGSYDGGEIRSIDMVGHGQFTARMRTPNAPGSISAFFLYQGRYRSDEIDIEILNGSRDVLLTTWAKGRLTHTVSVNLGFDPSIEFHDYQIDWTSSGVRFRVDGKLVHEWSDKLPRGAMYLMASAWWPNWLSGSTPGTDQSLAIAHVEVVPH